MKANLQQPRISGKEYWKRQGINEVVEWLKERVFDIDAPIPVGDSIYARFREPLLQVELQAKLKEWGIEK